MSPTLKTSKQMLDGHLWRVGLDVLVVHFQLCESMNLYFGGRGGCGRQRRAEGKTGKSLLFAVIDIGPQVISRLF